MFYKTLERIFTAKIATVFFFFLYFLYIKGANIKMSLISVEGYQNAGVHFLIIKNTGELWVNMKNVGDGLGVANISDLVLKEIEGIYEKKNLTKEEIKNYKMTEGEIFEKL